MCRVPLRERKNFQRNRHRDKEKSYWRLQSCRGKLDYDKCIQKKLGQIAEESQKEVSIKDLSINIYNNNKKSHDREQVSYPSSQPRS